MPKTLPVLTFSDKPLSWLLEEQITDGSLLITDPYNYTKLARSEKHSRQIVSVQSCKEEEIHTIKATRTFDKIIAVGGCTALDTGRSCCEETTELICIPTILSTTCISCDRSNIIFPNGRRLVKTAHPRETVISIPVLTDTSETELIRWTQSGFGDLFANISASIDFQYLHQDLTIDRVRNNVPDSFDALSWVLNHFDGYQEECLVKLATCLHLSSLDVISRDNTDLSAGGEHMLYHKLIERKISGHITATHGQIVGIGALIACKIFSIYSGYDGLYSDMRTAFEKLRFPVSFSEFEKIGLERDYLQKTLLEVNSERTILGNYFIRNGFEILDLIFGKKEK